MQLIEPGTHPAINGVILVFLLLIGFIGITLVLYGINPLKKPKFIFKYLSIILGLAIISVPAYNWINYSSISKQQNEKFIGSYINYETKQKIELKKDKIWESNIKSFPCKSGNWDYIISEDISYIQINGNCVEYMFLQIYSLSENHLTFAADQNGNSQLPVLTFHRVKN